MKKNLLAIIILALLLVNTGMTGFMMLTVMTTNNQAVALIGDIAAALQIEANGGENGQGFSGSATGNVDIANMVPYSIADMTISLKDDGSGKDAQVAHANIAIVGSNIIGKGPGKSVERDFLPQAFSDFIYVIIIEELGIIGAAFVAFLYIVLLYRAARIASRCENNFPAFLVMGLALMLVLQASFNMLVAVGIAPVTGQPLPLISRGGTSTIINCAYIGAILSVSRSAKKRGEKLALKEI